MISTFTPFKLGHKWKIRVFYFLVMAFVSSTGIGQNFQQVHDPSDPVFHNGRWYLYTTGDGIFGISKTSLTPTTGWRVEPRVFPDGFPEWITNYVPTFSGHFWAPHLMEDRIYYSCSSFGSKISAIGMAEGPPGGPYVDKGMVVFSNNTTSQGNAIDPFVFEDYLIYGSFFDGIYMVRLGEDGKPATTVRTKVIDGGARNAEAAFMTKHGEYYYLWFNRGSCCAGLNSTYYVQVGRSTNITGPFRDRNGTLLTSGGGTTVLSTSERYIAPGGSGVSGNTLVWHFYDGNANGAPRLMTGTISYPDNWPCVTPAYGDGGNHCSFSAPAITDIKSGDNYRITPKHAIEMGLDVANCGSTNGTNVRQWAWLNNNCQIWKFIYWGEEQWIISPNSATDKVLNVANASFEDNANINLWAFGNGTSEQQWELTAIGSNYYSLKNRNSGKCLEIFEASPENGGNLIQKECNELLAHQHFFILPPEDLPTSFNRSVKSLDDKISIFPNPVTTDRFSISIEDEQGKGSLIITDLSGKIILEKVVADVQSIEIQTNAKPGMYIIQVTINGTRYSSKILIR